MVGGCRFKSNELPPSSQHVTRALCGSDGTKAITVAHWRTGAAQLLRCGFSVRRCRQAPAARFAAESRASALQ
uniref:Uncharacterized protein n=1 Tax=Sphaerodactylus townsendi TaxID=933632 RepID=A0ACB8FNU7_9SAUR